MKSIITRYWKDNFWRHNAIFFAASLVIAFINYIYYPVLGRLMTVSNFGEVQTLLTIINIFGMLMAALQIVVINISTNSQDDVKSNNQIINQFEHAALLFMLGIALIIGLGSGLLMNFFNFSSFVPFIILGLTLISGVSYGFRGAYLQGKHDFTSLSISGVISATGKLLFSTILVVIGFKTGGAIAGLLIAQLIALIYSTRMAKNSGFIALVRQDFSFKKLIILKPQIKYLAVVLIVSLVSTLLINGDVLVVKRFFDPVIAGQYAGVSAIAKIIFFMTASFGGVLLASVGKSYKDEHNRLIVRKSFIIVSVISGSILLIFTIMPQIVINILIGERYLDQAELLPSIGLAVYLATLVNLGFYYLLALRNSLALPLAAFGGMATFLLTMLRHDSLELVVQNFIIGVSTLLVMLLVLAFFKYLRTPSIKLP